jgi:hypothetical protein
VLTFENVWQAYFEKMRQIWPALRELFNSAANRLGATEETMDVDMEESPDLRLQEMLLAIMAILERSLDCAEYIGPHKEEHCLVMLSSFSADPSGAAPCHMAAAAVGHPGAAPCHIAAAAVGAYRFFEPYVQQMPTLKLAAAVLALQVKSAPA